MPKPVSTPANSPAPTVEEHLAMIVQFLERMDRRERWRSFWSGIRNGLSMIPLIFFLGSLWYVYLHGQDLLQKIAEEAAKQAAVYTQTDFMKQFQHLLPNGQRAAP